MEQQKVKSGFNIFQKILLAMVLVALVPLGGLWYFNSHQASEDWRVNINSQLISAADGVVNTIDGWVDMNLRVLQQNAALDDIVSMEADRQNSILKTIGKAYEWAYLVFTVDSSGKNIGRSDGKPTKFYGDRQYFQQVMNGSPVGQQVLLGKTSGKPALVLSGPIQIGSQKRAGVLAMAMHLVDISEQVANVQLGTTGFALLLDKNGKAIAHGRADQMTGNLQDLSDHPALQAAGAGLQPIIYEEAGKRIVAYTKKTAMGWTLIVQQDYAEAFAPVRSAEHNALILLGITLILTISMALFLSQRIASPIRLMTAAAERLSRGKFDEMIAGTDRGDEIGALARAIERMGVSIRMAFDRLQQKAA